MPTTTPNLGLTLPDPNVSVGWGGTLNSDFTIIDNLFAAGGNGASVGLQVGSGKTLRVGGTFIGAGTVILGNGDGTATVTAPTIRGAARTGTNAAGVNLTIDAPNGTGTGGSGNIIFRTAPPGAAGSTPNTMRTVLEITDTGVVEVLGTAVSTPVGIVSPYAGTAAPSGWLLCFGQAVSRTTYAALFAVISTNYGIGDGSTTFNLPDLRGRVPAGKDDMGGAAAGRLTGTAGGVNGTSLGAGGGDQVHTLSIAEMPPHNHTLTAAIRVGSSQGGGGDNECNNASLTTDNTGGGAAHNNVQPTLILNYIIKA